MKVGIVTFSAARNYGAALQCRCLLEVLTDLGLDARVVDYRPGYLTEPYKILKPYYLKKPSILVQLPWRYWGALRRDRAFARFIPASRTVSLGDGGLDVAVFGSDQIWNPRICKGLDPVFFAAHPAFASTCNIAYAASDGSASLSLDEEAEYKRYVAGFRRIGVREKTLKDRLEAWGFSSEVTLDPVLLAGRTVLDRIVPSEYKAASGDFILTYEAVDNKRVREIAAGLGPRRVISIAREPYSYGRNCYGPLDFVALIRDAAKVVTTSFHGVAVALLYHKDFYYINTGTKADDRIRNLLWSIGLESRMLDPGAPLPVESPNYDAADSALAALRENSMNYLKEALQCQK